MREELTIKAAGGAGLQRGDHPEGHQHRSARTCPALGMGPGCARNNRIAHVVEDGMRIAFGSDHIAVDLKSALIDHLKGRCEVVDVGTDSATRVDYQEIAWKATDLVASGECERAILLCGTGVGMSLAANAVAGMRAVVCSEPYTARMSRQHNDTNVLTMGARVVGAELAKMIADVWLEATFEGGRHTRRIDAIMERRKKG